MPTGYLRRLRKSRLLMAAYVLMLLLLLVGGVAYTQTPEHAVAQQATPGDWHDDWAVAEGFSLELDTQGYNLPSAIAFVPNPGKGPKDPLYFVNELRGTIKVVTNDRSVSTFADNFFTLKVDEELPSGRGQAGLGGICLAPKQGYVFVTFAYQDKNKILRNSIMRFETTPGTFGLKPSKQTSFQDTFAPYTAGLAHHIGNCRVVDDNQLFVSVGESWQARESQKTDQLVGKIVRMNLDGKPLKDNPFYQDDDPHKGQNFVWAYGVRNPWGLAMVGDRLFAGDNGMNVDRFIEIKKGENYLWNGDDATIAAKADYVWTTSVGPVQVDHYPTDKSFFPEPYRNQFYVATFAQKADKSAGILSMPFDPDHGMQGAPQYFARYLGKGQSLTGLAFGPDGLYFSTIYPSKQGVVGVYRITYDPAHAHVNKVSQSNDPFLLMKGKGCLGCHKLNNDGGYGGTAGPALDQAALVPRLEQRLNSDQYLKQLAEIDKLDAEPQRSYAKAREEVRKAQGIDRVRTWVKYRALEPRFDNVSTPMPNVGLTEQEATLVASYLVDNKGAGGIKGFVKSYLPAKLSLKHLAIFFAAGGIGGLLLAGVLGMGGSWYLRRRRARKA